LVLRKPRATMFRARCDRALYVLSEGAAALSKILRYRKYRAMRWRNGQGTTLEIAREPPGGEPFAWRLSLATLERSCNFSAYPGYRRALVLVSGEKLHLTFWRHGRRRLGPESRWVRFDGSWRTRCALAGPCTDLSLIVRDDADTGGRSILRAPRVIQARSKHRLYIPGGLYAALVSLVGTVSVADVTGSRRRLGPLDTLLLSPAHPRSWTIGPVGGRRAELVLLQWRPGCAIFL